MWPGLECPKQVQCGGSRSGLVLALHEELGTRRGGGKPSIPQPGQPLGGSPPRMFWTHPHSLKPSGTHSEPLFDPWGHCEFSTHPGLYQGCALCLRCLSWAILGKTSPCGRSCLPSHARCFGCHLLNLYQSPVLSPPGADLSGKEAPYLLAWPYPGWRRRCPDESG